MIIKIVDRNSNLEKDIQNIRKHDLVNFECDSCHKNFTYKYRPKRFDINGKQLCSLCKSNSTNLKNYGSINPNGSKIVRDKIKATSLERYGVDNISKLPETQLKIKATSLERYGVDSTNKLESVKQNKIKSCIEKYGVDNPSRVKEVQLKRENTCLKHFGVNTSLKDPITKKKIENTNLERYGAENVSKCPQIIQKINDTKRKNHTFNTSKPEEEAYKLLEAKFGNVAHQYKEIRYPFYCDFYIPEKDLFIECNFTWSHAKEPFETNNTKHVEKLNKWRDRSKTHPWYNCSIETWTIRDPLKRKTAKENNLNYLEFFNLQDLTDYIANCSDS